MAYKVFMCVGKKRVYVGTHKYPRRFVMGLISTHNDGIILETPKKSDVYTSKKGDLVECINSKKIGMYTYNIDKWDNPICDDDSIVVDVIKYHVWRKNNITTEIGGWKNNITPIDINLGEKITFTWEVK